MRTGVARPGSLFDEDLTLPDDPIALRRVINSWWVNDEIHRMVLDPRIGRMASVLYSHSIAPAVCGVTTTLGNP